VVLTWASVVKELLEGNRKFVEENLLVGCIPLHVYLCARKQGKMIASDE
jgi:hypothetical protein